VFLFGLRFTKKIYETTRGVQQRSRRINQSTNQCVHFTLKTHIKRAAVTLWRRKKRNWP